MLLDCAKTSLLPFGWFRCARASVWYRLGDVRCRRALLSCLLYFRDSRHFVGAERRGLRLARRDLRLTHRGLQVGPRFCVQITAPALVSSHIYIPLSHQLDRFCGLLRERVWVRGGTDTGARRRGEQTGGWELTWFLFLCLVFSSKLRVFSISSHFPLDI